MTTSLHRIVNGPAGGLGTSRDDQAAATEGQCTADLNRGWADCIAAALSGGGVQHVFLSPGSRSTPLVLAADRHAPFRTHVILDERAAGFAALGLARSSGRPVALVCTSGSAAGHYLPAVMEADRSRVPLVVLTADRPPERHGCGAAQTIEQRRLYASYARAVIDLGAPDGEVTRRWVALRVTQAAAAATAYPAGPVHVNVAFRKPFWSIQSECALPPPDGSPPVIVRGRPTLESRHVAAVARQLAGARRGLIVCGLLPETHSLSGWPAALSELAAALRWPVLAEPTSQLRFAHPASPLVLDAYDGLLRAPAWAADRTPDVVLRFGQAPTSRAVGDWLARRPARHTLLVDPGGRWHDPSISAGQLLVADPTWLGRALTDALTRHAPDRDLACWTEGWVRANRVAAAALAASSHDGLCEGAISRTVVEAMAEGSLLFVASSMPVRDLETFAPRLEKNIAVAANRGVNGIDGLVATAFGAAVGWAPRPVVGVLGDLALLHDLDGLLAASQWCRQADHDGPLGVELTIVVLNNGGGGIFEHLPIAGHPTFERYFLTPPQAVDLAPLCQGLGVAYARVGRLELLRRVLSTRQPGLRLVEVPVDRAQSNALRRDGGR